MEGDRNFTSPPKAYANVSGSASEENGNRCVNFLSTCTSQWTTSCTFQLVMACITCIIYVLIITVNGGIVVYENVVADTYRTLANKMVALMSGYNMLIATSMVPPALSNNFCLQLNSTYCTVNLIISLMALLQVILIHNELAILLSWSTRSIGSVQKLNEDIGRKILNGLNLTLSTLFSLTLCMGFGKEDIFIYRLCTGHCLGKSMFALHGIPA